MRDVKLIKEKRNKYMRIRTYLISTLFVLCLSSVEATTNNNVQPNVLLILSDDHSAPYLGCYGNPDLKTPNLDKLASEGLLFNKAYTNAPQCVQSRASILTCRNVLDVGMLRFSSSLDREYITFPELMKQHGYYIGVCGRPYHLDGPPDGLNPPESEIVYEEFNLHTFADRFDYVNSGPDEVVESQVKEFIEKVPDNKPFFMWVNYSDPHRIFTAKEYEPDPNSITMPEGIPDTKGFRKDLAGHYGEIQRLDKHVGDLLAMLEMKKLLENTIIFFMGDNGAALLRGKGTLYEFGVNVPLIAWYPKQFNKGAVSDVLVAGLDVGTTILDVVGIEKHPEMTGKSFSSALKGNEEEINEYIFTVRGPHASALPKGSASFDLSRSVLNKKFKLIYNPLWHLPFQPVDFNGSYFWQDAVNANKRGELDKKFSTTVIFKEQRPMFEFFDLEKDPHELINVSGKAEYAEAEKTLKTAMQRWMIMYKDVVPLPITNPRKKKH